MKDKIYQEEGEQYNDGYQKGVEFGKQEQKKEELEFLKKIPHDPERWRNCPFCKRIKQLEGVKRK